MVESLINARLEKAFQNIKLRPDRPIESILHRDVLAPIAAG